jgi:ankyrin repeat protein
MKDHDDRLPIHWATDNESTECISLLLDRVPGQTVEATDAGGMTPLMWAAYHNKVRQKC